MSEFLHLLTVNLASVLGLMFLLWLVSLVRRDASVVDPFWGTGFVVALSLQAGVWQPAAPPLWWLDFGGWGLWTLGFTFEVVGDWQLARFTSNPDNRGRVLDRGLWRYTRHPNYFGDFCVWWGLYLIAAAAGAWWTLPGPLLMSLLLMRVSGVPLLEKDIAERRAGYAAYVARTSAFFPAPPRS
jgi:steroid 5-alpha reductase family enzyme